MTWRENYKEKSAFTKVRHAENGYSRRLRKLAQHVHDLIYDFITTEEYPNNLSQLVILLERYANIVEPWARSVATRWVAEVARRDEKAWNSYTKNLSFGIQQEIQSAPVGEMLREFLEEQVQLITSLPLEAAQRVHQLALGNLYGGARAEELSEHILETGNISKNRATTIARTETARVSSALTMFRAQAIGSEGYIWRSVLDFKTRSSHRAMEGKFIRWDSPPEVEPGKFYHAGQYINCRCFADVQIPDKYLAKAA